MNKKINFILPFLAKTGGILVILEHSRHLSRMGFDVALYYPLMPYPDYWRQKSFRLHRVLGPYRAFLLNLIRYARKVPWYWHPHEVKPVLRIRNKLIRDADAVVATAWPTAYDVDALSPSKGKKFYFVQGFEIWSGDPRRTEASYRLPLSLVTISPWLTELMRERFHREAVEVRNGVDLELFRPPSEKPMGVFSILMLFHTLELKGAEDGLAVLSDIHARFPHVRIILFGLQKFPDPPAFVEYFRDPSPQVLVELYQSAHVFLCPSRNEGWHLPPMEAMACGCALVATRVGCIPSLENGENMLVVEPRDRAGMIEKLVFLIERPDECARIAKKGLQTIQGYGWEKSSARLAAVLAG